MPSEELRKQRKAMGLCRCGKELQGKCRCPECYAKMQDQQREWRERRKGQGFCLCGRKAREGKKTCKRCGAKHSKEVSAAMKKNLSGGLCHCGKERLPRKRYCVDCRSRALAYLKDRPKRGLCRVCADPIMPGRTLCQRHIEEMRIRHRRTGKERRTRVIAAYGGKCKCCGQTTPEFLTLDHVNNDGAKHRREMGSKRAYNLYLYAEKNGFPDRLQLLCWNCNLAKARYGICPHERDRNKLG